MNEILFCLFGKLMPYKHFAGTAYQCRCNCGRKCLVDSNKLLAGTVRSCGLCEDDYGETGSYCDQTIYFD